MSTEGGAGLPGTKERVLSWCVIAVAKTVGVAVRGLAPVLRPILRRLPPDPALERTWKNAEHLIAACRAFQAKHGQLPGSLEQLVPEFLPALPPARYEHPEFGWDYHVSDDSKRHVLSWTFRAPFGRHVYRFEEDRWLVVD